MLLLDERVRDWGDLSFPDCLYYDVSTVERYSFHRSQVPRSMVIDRQSFSYHLLSPGTFLEDIQT